MKKIIIVCATIVALSAASVQASYDLTVNAGSPRAGNGGEFLITPGTSTDWASIGIANGATGAFDSFCLETDETLAFGGSYFATLNTGSVHGGANIPAPPPAGFDQISKGTAWLFRQHWDLGGASGIIGTGAVVNYDITVNADAVELQNAIWWLEEESVADQAGNKYLDAAVAALPFGTHAALRVDADPYEYDVGVLNLWGVDPDTNSDYLNHYRQDILVVVPEPSVLIGTMASCVFGFIAFRRRRQNQKS